MTPREKLTRLSVLDEEHHEVFIASNKLDNAELDLLVAKNADTHAMYLHPAHMPLTQHRHGKCEAEGAKSFKPHTLCTNQAAW